jgi:hypothetical protein
VIGAEKPHLREDATMPERANANGVIHSEPIYTDNYGRSLVATEDGEDSGAFATEDGKDSGAFVTESAMIASVGYALGRTRREFKDALAAQAKRISELELKLAEANGALDVLRGKGTPGALRIRGTFDANTVYNHLDCVALNGGSFVARKDAPGPCPGPDWQLLASVGKRGPRGERGPIGHTGAAAPRLVSLNFDARSNSFVTKMSDGSRGPTFTLFASVGTDAKDYSIKFTMHDGTAGSNDCGHLFRLKADSGSDRSRTTFR